MQNVKHTNLNIAVIGTGYVGIASAIGFAEFGHSIIGYDILDDRIAQLKRGRTPYHESGLTESLTKHITSGAVSFTHDFKAAVSTADMVVIAVGTPASPDGSADLSGLEAVVSALCEVELNNAVVVVRSTIPAGTCDGIADRLSGRAEVVFAPEFLREGSAVSDFLNPDRVVVGSRSRAAAERYANLFAHLGCPTLFMSLKNAELSKGMANAFLAMKISFANQVANLCDEIDADALDVLRAVGSDSRIGEKFLQPGIGFGGPCFEKDLKSLIHLSKRLDADFDLFRATLEVNDRQPTRILRMLREELGDDLRGVRLGVWGLTFKAGTDDLRDSLALRIVKGLVESGAVVKAYDPSFNESRHVVPCEMTASPLDAADADALVVLTEWPQFRSIDAWTLARRIGSGVIVDGRNVLDGDALAAAGLRYRGIGRRREADDADLAEVV